MKSFLHTLLLVLFSMASVAQISPVDSYDHCENAIELTVNNTCAPGTATYTTVGATRSPQPTTAPSADDDVWFKFTTLPGQSSASISTPEAAGGMGNCFELWANCSTAADAAPVESGCGSVFNVSGLTPATTYLVRVYTNGSFARLSSFKMCVVDNTPPPPPPNSECNFATSVIVGSNALDCQAFPVTNRYATGSTGIAAPACISSGYRDIWLKFTPASSGPVVFKMPAYEAVSGSAFPLYNLALYSSTSGCATLNLMGCSNYFPASGGDITLPGEYTAGTTYYIRMLCANDIEGNFTVCLRPGATTSSYPISPDSTCSRAITINASADASAAYTQGSTNGIRVISQLACYGSNAPNALAWYKFTVPQTGNYYVDFTDIIRLSLNAAGLGFRLLKASNCYSTPTDTIITTPPAGSYDTLLCVGLLGQNQSVNLTAGTQYFLTVMENSYNGGRVAYKLRVVGTTPPANDERAGAISLVQGTDCSGTGNVPATIRFSTLSTNPSAASLPGSAGFTQDVWYRFVAATATASINVNLLTAFTRIVVYNNDASLKYDPATNASLVTVNNLTPGLTYFIRIINTQGTPVGPNADFNICVFGVPTRVLELTPDACAAADVVLESTNSNRWLHFTKAGNLLVSVFDGPAVPGLAFTPRGNIQASVFNNTGGLRVNAGTAYLDRNFELSDGGKNFTGSPVRIRFYFTPEQFNRLVADNASRGISAPYELKIYRIPGVVCSATTTAGGLYYNNAGAGFIPVADNPLVPAMYWVDMITPNFSGFFLQQADQQLLPALCGSFTYRETGDGLQVQLQTLTEWNVSRFVLESSSDGIKFNALEAKPALNRNNSSYTWSITRPNAGTNYFRVKQVNTNGSSSQLCQVLSVPANGYLKSKTKVYPNPLKGQEILLQTSRKDAGHLTIQLLSPSGVVLKAFQDKAANSTAPLALSLGRLPAGVYFLKIAGADGVEVQRIIKE